MTSARQRVKAAIKSPVRGVLRRGGYELIPAERDFQRDLVALMDRLRIVSLVDVGANQGQYAEHARAAGYQGKIISFEPGGAAYGLLRKHSASDDMWEARQLALGDAAGHLDLNVSINSVSSSLLTVTDAHTGAAPASAVAERESVRVARLDEEMPDLAGPAMLKIDTQGYELHVLRGATEVLDRIDIVQAELSLVELYEGQPTYLDVLRFLEDSGFAPYAFIPGFTDPLTGAHLQVDVVASRVRPPS